MQAPFGGKVQVGFQSVFHKSRTISRHMHGAAVDKMARWVCGTTGGAPCGDGSEVAILVRKVLVT